MLSAAMAVPVYAQALARAAERAARGETVRWRSSFLEYRSYL